MSNYLIYPFKVMRITQSYTGTTSHLPHTTGSPKDYPLDEGADDTGRSYIYCPCNEMKIDRIYGVGNKGVNTVWLTSTSKVTFADGTSDYATIMCEHPNDDDLKKLKVGQTFKRKEAMFREGADGATGNHIHIAVGKGKVKGNGWTTNSNSKYVLTTEGGAVKPEQAFFIDPSFTKVVNKKGLKFKELPKEDEPKPKPKEKFTTGEYKVDTDLLYVRAGAGTKYAKKTFSQLTSNARKEILKRNKGVAVNGYVRGIVFDCSAVKEANDYHWGKTPSGWVALEFCKKV